MAKSTRLSHQMESGYRVLADTIRQNASKSSSKRYIVAIAGVPGCGKTTIAEAAVKRLNADGIIRAAFLSMDGFHLPQATLNQMPNSTEAYKRRGAPWTYDVERFLQYVYTLRTWAEENPLAVPYSHSWTSNEEIRAPNFDHEAKDPVEDGISVTPDVSIIIVEGNYLLLDQPVWRNFAALFDYRVFVQIDPSEARERTARRHVGAGLERALEDGYRRVDDNDSLNAVLIQENLLAPDLIIQV